MKDFKEVLYESVVYSYGVVLSKYNAFAQDTVLKDVGKEIIDYLQEHGYEFKESGSIEDLGKIVDLFVSNGFAGELKVEKAEKGDNYYWKNLFGEEAYSKLQKVTENPFLSCPLNACLYYIADKHNKTLKLHKKSFDLENNLTFSQEEIIDKVAPEGKDFDALVIENARLYEIAEKRAKELEKALSEIKKLQGILPICAECKKIRDDKGYWNQVEDYIHDHSEAGFTHGICPDCSKKVLEKWKKNQKNSEK